MRKNIRKTVEIIVANLVIFGANILFTDDPGFASIYFAPSLVLAVFFAAYYGRRFGVISLGAAALTLLVPRVPGIPYWEYLKPLLVAGGIPTACAVILIYIFGLIRSGYERGIMRLRERLRQLARENWRYRELIESQAEVSRELEERVSRQWESITNLYTQVQTLNTRNLESSLSVLLETIRIFTRITKGSVWYFDPEEPSELFLAAQTGWTDEETMLDRLPMDGSIEGWVFRNGTVFSVRMLNQSEQFAKIDTSRNIITLPIFLGRDAWGVVNIEEMPFVKYNRYTEQILTIIIDLAHPAIEKAVEYEALLRGEEIDEATGLPRFGQLHRLLDGELKKRKGKRGSVSLLILEITNVETLSQAAGNKALPGTFTELVSIVEGICSGRVRYFRYRQENQIAVIFTDLDYDGASMYCFELISRINDHQWRLEGGVSPEVILGYAVSQEGMKTPEELMEGAERLLEIQKG